LGTSHSCVEQNKDEADYDLGIDSLTKESFINIIKNNTTEEKAEA
jgi:hypothetical protein